MLQGSMGLDDSLSNLTSTISNEASINSSSNVNGGTIRQQQQQYNPTLQPPSKKRRNLPGNPDPDAEVVALSPRSLMATNRFVCEICNKGFQREQNLQLHRRGHNLPWKLKQRSKQEVIRKKVYVCPEASCVHHHPARALGDLTGIKKHFSRKHGEKKWKCDKCSKRYAVHSDWKAHSKICGTREYPCHCGTLFSRRDSFITHRAFCDALAEENSKGATPQTAPNQFLHHPLLPLKQETLNFTHPPWHHHHLPIFPPIQETPSPNTSLFAPSTMKPPPLMSATALLQKAAQMAAYDEDEDHDHHDHRESVQLQVGADTAGGLPSREEMLHGLAAYGGSKLANLTAACMETSSGYYIIQEHHVSMLPSTSGFDGFDDSFNGIFSAKGNAIPSFQQDAHFMGLRKGGAAVGGGGDGMTRDFLGLRGFPHSHRGLSNMAGLHHMGSSSSFDQNQAPWQS